jgi:hypothetical protein
MSTPPFVTSPIFNVSGVNGASGTSGTRFYTTASYGYNGVRGDHGTDGQHGTSAGTIAVRLATPITTANLPKKVVLANPIEVDVQLDASIVYSNGQRQKVDTILKLSLGESICFYAFGGNGGNGGHGGHGQHGGEGIRFGAFLVLYFNEPISEYAWRTGDGMQLDTVTAVMGVLEAMEEMAVTQVEAVMVDQEEPFESLFP